MTEIAKQDTTDLLPGDVHLFGEGTRFSTNFLQPMLTRTVSYILVLCVFFLLPDKSKITYINMLQHRVHSCSQVGVDLKIPVVLHLDFEIAVHEAVRLVWPNVIIKACQFHLGQAWYRKIQKCAQTLISNCAQT